MTSRSLPRRLPLFGWLLAFLFAGPTPGAASPTGFDSTRTRAAHEWYWDHMDAPRDSLRARLLAGLALARQAGDQYGEIGYLNDLGSIAIYSGGYAEAQRTLSLALARIRTNRQPRWLWITNANLGVLATELGDDLRAVGFYEAALGAARRYRPVSPTAEIDILSSLVTVNGRLRRRGAMDRAARQAIALAAAQGDRYAAADVTCSWAGGLLNLGEPDSAARLLEPALRTLQQVKGPPPVIATAQALLVQAYAGQRAWAKMLALYPVARRAAWAVQDEIDLLKTMGAYLRAHNQPAAFDTLRRAMQLQDSVRTKKKDQEVARLQVEFDVARQQARIHGLEQQRRITRLEAERQTIRTRALLAAAGALAVILIGIGWFYLRLRRTSAALTRSEGQLRQAIVTKDQLMSIIGHDLRSPVATFQQVTPLLHQLADSPDPPVQHEIATALDGSAHHLGALLDNLLYWAQAEAGSLANHPQVLPVDEVLASAAAPYVATAELKGLVLDTAVHRADDDDTGPLHVTADLNLLRTVLRNLVSNAVKFTPAGGQVRVRAWVEAPGEVTLEVRDTGVGIAPDRAATLFRAGERRSTAGTAGEPGTGLGLPLSARFVRLLGSELQVVPLPAGQPGTAFRFRLPLAAVDHAQTVPEP